MPVQVKLIAGVILLALAGFGLWYLRHEGYEEGKTEVTAEWKADQLMLAEAQKLALISYAEKINQAEVQHDQDQALIDRLHNDAGRVRIHLPACPANAAVTGPGQNGTAGVLSNRVDQRFAEFQARVGSLIARCDQLNIDAIRANAGH